MRSRYIRMILKSLVIHITIVKSTKIFSLEIFRYNYYIHIKDYKNDEL